MTTTDARIWITPDDASALLGVSRRTILEWTRIGILPAVKIGKIIRIRRAALDTALSRLESRRGR